MGFAAKKKFIWWGYATLRKEIHKLVQFCVVMEIRPEFHLPSGY